MSTKFSSPLRLYVDNIFHNQLKTIQLQWESRGVVAEKMATYIANATGEVIGVNILSEWLNKPLGFDAMAIGKLMSWRDEAGNNIFSEGFLNYLQRFRFAGTLRTMPESTLVFEAQPILQVKGNAIQVAILQLWIQHLIQPTGKIEEITHHLQVRRFYDSDLQYIQDIIFSPDSEPIVNFEAANWQDLLQPIIKVGRVESSI